jgi:hypothetical protein
LKRIEREVQAVTTGDMAIVSNLSGSDFTLVCNSAYFVMTLLVATVAVLEFVPP